MDVNFELYKVFYYVAAKLSFSDAAAKLYISQSAVSQSIKLLEEQLDTKLFMRNTKQVKLTPDGELLYKHVEQAFNFIKTGERNLQEVHSLERGEIRIGASDTICRHYLLPYLRRYNQLYPQVKISITNRPSSKCAELLLKGRIDISIANIPAVKPSKGLNIIELITINDVFIAGPAYKHLQNSELSLQDITEYPILALEPHSVTRSYLDKLFEQNELHITPEFELGSVDLLLDLVKIGLGISFVSKEFIQKELALGEIFILKVNAAIMPRRLGILTLKHMPVPIAAQKFIELLQNQIL
ncbi:MAG: LysR family transcriptional regulator [Veillonellaceae bacterium]|jgi:DNA-binding transcriptional LysR family regulator|nr:LysR family transcriptional regulator [Veillonellaceae bacterium]